MSIDSHYLSPEGRAAVKARADILRDDIAARRALRATAQRLDIDLRLPPLPERRATNDPGRKAWTMEDRLAMQHASREMAKYTGAGVTGFGFFD